MTTYSEYEQMRDKLKAETAQLTKERQEIDQRLMSLKQSIDGLNALIQQMGGPPPDIEVHPGVKAEPSLGLTDSIKGILKNAGTLLSATEIRNELVRRGFNPDEYSNFLTVIHNTLRRLVTSHDIGFAEIGGKTVYMQIEQPDALRPRGVSPRHLGRTKEK
jgi:hypothetical protein